MIHLQIYKQKETPCNWYAGRFLFYVVPLIVQDESIVSNRPTEGVGECHGLQRRVFAICANEERSIRRGDRQLVGCFVDSDPTEIVDSRKSVVIERA